MRSEGRCWIWPRGNSGGYGMFWRDKKRQLVHKYAWECEYGPIPVGLELDHVCRNKACFRPSHLEAVTHQVNVQRGNISWWNKQKTHCPRNHEYGIRVGGKRGPHRVCRECERVRCREAYRNKEGYDVRNNRV